MAGVSFEAPTLGWMHTRWIVAHCVVPDGFDLGKPFVPSGWQQLLYLNHYRVKPTAKWRPERPMLATAFHNRRSQVVRPQKAGKAPASAAMVCLEGVGPVLFRGWADGGEVYDCAEHGCRCGWGYEYELGEPMGMRWPTPLIQITAFSEDQTDNIYSALRPMIDEGPLHALIPKTGEEFIRLPGVGAGGRIDTVTSNARSRLGARVTFPLQDETGLWTAAARMIDVAETQRRGAAGMGGRAVETTNGWDPTQHSVAQRTAESNTGDIYRDHPLAPAKLSYKNKRERARIHRIVYAGSPWVDLDAIEAEAVELLETDPAQAERFFGNRIVEGAGHYFDADRWKQLARPGLMIAPRELVVAGVDGARFKDALAMIATGVVSGHQWTLDIIERPESAGDDYEHDFERADGAMIEFFETFDVWRVYVDPQWIDPLMDRWSGRWGDKIRPWLTHRYRAMALALRAYRAAQTSGDLSHDGNPVLAAHIEHAVRRPIPAKDDEGRPLSIIEKPTSGLKIDGAAAGTLSWEARGDAIAAGAEKRTPAKVYAF